MTEVFWQQAYKYIAALPEYRRIVVTDNGSFLIPNLTEGCRRMCARQRRKIVAVIRAKETVK